MSEPVVRAWRARPELADWFWTCARYPTALMARAAWERIERKTAGGGELGLYRHGPSDDPGVLVTAIGLDRSAVERCVRLLRDGVDERLPLELVESMALRRARVALETSRQHPGESGRVKIRRPEAQGVPLDRGGVMRERPPGRG